MPTTPSRLPIAALAALLALTAALYWPGLTGPFKFDDFHNVVNNPKTQMPELDAQALRGAAYSGGSVAGFPLRGLARATFALNHWMAGGRYDALTYKLTNVAIHLLNGVLVYLLAVRLLGRWQALRAPPPAADPRVLALVVAALWLLHPIQLTSVLYVVQRMTSLSATFVLAGLLVFLAGRARVEAGQRHGLALAAGGVCGGVALGALGKENAVLLPYLAVLVEIVFFRLSARTAAGRRGLLVLYGATAVLPALAGIALVAARPELVTAGYALRDFGLAERLLTEARVLFFYLGALAFPDIRSFGIYHDDIAVSRGLLDPWTTLPAVAAWLVLAGLAVRGALRRRLWAFGLLWYLIGHGMESTVIALEIAHEHRNYLPSFGVLLAVVGYGAAILRRVSDSRWLRPAVATLAVIGLSIVTLARASVWGDPRALAYLDARNHTEAYRAQQALGYLWMYEGRDIREIYDAFRASARANPRAATPLIEMRKIVLALDGLLARYPPDAAPLERAPAGADFLERPLPFDRAALAALGAALDAAIHERFAAATVHVESVYGLENVAGCAQRGLDHCAPLMGSIIDWHEAAIANPRIEDYARAGLLVSVSKLYAYAADFERAEARLLDAVGRFPERMAMLYEMAGFYRLLDAPERAQRAVDAVARGMAERGAGAAEVDAFRGRYAEASAALRAASAVADAPASAD